MSLWKEYLQPQTVQEAVEALASAPPPAIPIAGGTDLMIDLQQGHHAPVHTLVDLTGIAEMRALEIRAGQLFIGAGVPHNRIVESALVQEHAQSLVESCGLIGGPQVRNSATLGGNVAHALPAADGMIGLLALEAEAQVASPSGRRLQPLHELFLGPGKTALKADEVLVGFYLPLIKAHQASAFCRVMRAQGIALPILNLAAWLERDGETIRAAQIAVGPSGPVPFRARQTEAFLAGKVFSAETIAGAQETLLAEAKFRTSAARATAEYRRELVVVLLKNALSTAWERAK
ncbi:MAG: FAD binding domain-containing protein [Anaerolineales bacterium]|jgi:carbon-monoxide dehydrogenase medium subunit|nr:FAD binding domain-containing protein [Anaerolineales bacterium]